MSNSEENSVNRFVNKLLEENYNLKLSINNYQEIFDTKDRVHNKLNQDYLVLKKKYEKLTRKKSNLEFILSCLEASCEYDESCNVEGLFPGHPERDRYHDLCIARDKLRSMLE
jgi:hypothetical protein